MSTFTDPKLMKLFRHNYKAMMSESALFWIATAFIDANTVISVFIYTYTGSLQLAGLAQVSRTISFLVAQFLAGFVLMGVANRGRMMRVIGAVTRGLVLFMVPALLLGLEGSAAVILLIVCLSVFNMGDGFVGLIWTGISARTIPGHLRGQMIGNAQILAGLFSLAAGFVIKWILASALPGAEKYSLIFGLSGFFFLCNAAVLCIIKDRDDAPYATRKHFTMRAYVSQFVSIFRSMPRVRLVVLSRAVYTLSLMAASLVVLFGQSHLGLTVAQTSSMVYLQMGGVLLGGLFWGRLSRYFSTSTVMIGSMAMGVIIGTLGVTAFLLGPGGGAAGILYAMVFLTGFNQSSWVGYTNELIRLSDEHTRNTMLVMQSLLQLPTSFGPYFAGLIAEKSGFLPVFLIVLGCGLAGLLLTGVLFAGRNAPVMEVQEGGVTDAPMGNH